MKLINFHLHTKKFFNLSCVADNKAIMYLIIPVLLFLFENTAYSQQNISKEIKEKSNTVSSNDSAKKTSYTPAPAEASNYTPSSYPGGSPAWRKYLIYNLIVPEEARNIKFDGSIAVTFTVDETGKLKDFHASPGPDALQKEAIRIVKKSGKWNPAYNNGKPIQSQCTQTITFKLNT